MSPFVVQISNSIGINPLISFGSIGIFSALTLFFLRETLNKQLPDRIEEVRKSILHHSPTYDEDTEKLEDKLLLK